MYKPSIPTPADMKPRANEMRVLGVDPGFDRLGLAILEGDPSKPQLVWSACVEPAKGEMSVRLRKHQGRRGAGWLTVEEPIDRGGALISHALPSRAVMVDCLTLWLTNVLLAGADVDAQIDRLASVLPGLHGQVVFVSNEVGQGIVPDNALARAFRDHAGRLNQLIAARCQRVVFVVAGLPMLLKDVR